MITWIIIIIYVCIAVYTAKFAVAVWKENNKPGSIFVLLLAGGLIVLPVYILFR